MKDFWKFTFATVLGIILTGVILSVISLFTLLGILVNSDSTTKVERNSVMVLNLSGEVTEQSRDNPFSALLGEDYANAGLKDIILSIEKAKNHERIKGIYLKAGVMVAPPAAIQEMRDALLDFKESGKFILSYADVYTQGNYYLCSVADKMILNPQGTIAWTGMSSQIMYYKDLLDKLGIEMQVFKVGTYKSAVEPYLSNEMSAANREQTTVFLNSIWDQIVEGIAQSRQLSKDSLSSYADQLVMMSDATQYVAKGMVDTLIYKNDMDGYLKTLLNIEPKKKLHTLSLDQMKNVENPVKQSGSDNIIAVYYAEGGIDLSTNDGIISEKVCKALQKLREDEDVKAVVLRVNSPGGSAFGSEQIWHEVMLTKAMKPVIVSMGGYAASGGYYISCAADKIYAQPTTLTGSIGIFGMFPNMEKLMNDKLGIHTHTVKTNNFSDFGNTTRPITEEEKAYVQAYIDRGYELFVTRCADGRGMSKEVIKQIAEGRVWTGETAKEIGLVDELGGLDEAITYAAERAGLTNYTLTSYPEPENFLMRLLNLNTDEWAESRMKSTLGSFYPCYQWLQHAREQDPIQARMPYEIEINL